MSSQVLARKWRPRNFDTLVGQQHVVKALTHALTHQRLHHAYLFTGTRGVGKTTIARIIAQALGDNLGQQVVIENHPQGLLGSRSPARQARVVTQDGSHADENRIGASTHLLYA